MTRALFVLLPLLLFTACRLESPDDGPTTEDGPVATMLDPVEPAEAALAVIDSTTLYQHVAELSSDEYEGRGTGTPGEQKTIEYIARQMEALGLEGGLPDGSFFQPVPLRGATITDITPLTLTPADGDPVELAFVDEFIASTDLDATEASIENTELVFVGYGITNPGYSWDDYKDVDVTGKVIVSFVNDPPATEDEPTLFQADTLTYNGRWTYKYEEARRRGALGALLIHTEPTASYPFTVLSNGARGEDINLQSAPEGALPVKGWITQESAEQLAQMAGTTLNAWFEQAASRDFRPQELPVTASVAMELTTRTFEGTNVIGKLEGGAHADEAIIYTAHHDHLGKDDDLIAQGQDGIYNGAVDNASGVSMLLTIAKAFTEAERPARSVYFATLSAEESGLLGSNHYALNPVVPLARTIANVNVDSGNLAGPTEDIVGVGAERSEMLRYLRQAAEAEDMTVGMDPNPNAGSFFRSDQLAFARGGVPAVFIRTGRQFVGQPEDYAAELEAEYRANRYHQPADELSDGMPFSGLVQQTRVAFRLGYLLASSSLRPEWKPSEAFAQTRTESEQALEL
ncbi:MAG: M28 family peptidase [Rhodothermaceae bacterium]|nr:M28 family peptidase [Rhodothermaceae bacterium]